MYLYLIMFVYIAILGILETLRPDKRIVYFSVFSIYILLLMVAGFRFETGVDWKTYNEVYEHARPIFSFIADVKSGYYEKDMDIGYVFLCSFIKTLGGGNQLIFFIVSLFTITNLIFCLREYTPNIIIAVLVYFVIFFFVLELSGIRQCIAVNIFFFAIRYIESKNFIAYTSLIIIASLFHWSAIFLFPFYFLLRTNIPSLVVGVIFLGSLVIYFFQIRWLKMTLQLFFPIISDKRFMEKALVYTSASAYATSREITLIVIANTTMFLVILSILILFRKNFQYKYKYFNVFFNLFMVNFIVYFCTAELIDISSRIQYYFLLSNIILFSYISSIFKSRVERVIINIAIIFYCMGISRGYLFHSRETIAYHPYQNYILHKALDLKSTGRMRLEIHQQIHIKDGFIDE